MKKLIEKGMSTVSSVADKALIELTQQYTYVKDVINGLPVFASSQKTKKFGEEKIDEKHYFVVPYMPSETKIALHSIRCLPHGVPEINDLPKRRVFHFPNEHSEALLRKVLKDSAAEIVKDKHEINSLETLANDIDAIDTKLSYGVLFIGGMAAIINPILGAGIAIKAFLPVVAGMLSKYGLRPAGEKMSQSQLTKKVKEAERRVLKEFEEASTIQVVNPILQELELALNTTEKEHDPIVDFDLSKSDLPQLDGERWRELTESAIYHVYKDTINDPNKHHEAKLGPEDIRWLKIILSRETDSSN